DDADRRMPEQYASHANQRLPEQLGVLGIQHAWSPLPAGAAHIFGMDEEFSKVCGLVDLLDRKRRESRRSRTEHADQCGIALRGLRLDDHLVEFRVKLLGQRLENNARTKHGTFAQHKVSGEMASLPTVAKGVGGRSCRKQGLGQRKSGSLN